MDLWQKMLETSEQQGEQVHVQVQKSSPSEIKLRQCTILLGLLFGKGLGRTSFSRIFAASIRSELDSNGVTNQTECSLNPDMEYPRNSY